MAGIGLRYPYFAKYNYDESTGKVTYSDGGLMGKAVELAAKIDQATDNNLRADDGIAESDSSFGGGTLDVTTDDLTQEVSAAILGLISEELQVGDETVRELIFDENRKSQDLGFGIIIPKKKNGKPLFRAVVFTKVQYSVPEESAKTMGEKIEWQTSKLSGTIMRDDTPRHMWKRETTVESEALARAYVKQILNIEDKDSTLASLTLGNLSLSPSFDKAKTSYSAATSNATNTITATATDSGATLNIRVNGSALQNGSAATWVEGDNAVVITVMNGAAEKAYTVTVTKTAVTG